MHLYQPVLHLFSVENHLLIVRNLDAYRYRPRDDVEQLLHDG